MEKNDLLGLAKEISGVLNDMIKEMEKETKKRWHFEFEMMATDLQATKIHNQIKHCYPDYLTVGSKEV